VDSIREVPPDRWNADSFYDRDPAVPGKMNTRWGGFLRQIDGFDASFFGISPREAVGMDPQQRLLLEVTWEALEDAGQVRESLAGEPVGVFIGISTYDYGGIQLRNPLGIVDGYLTTGSALSIAANRISYFFDFRGPSMAIDTACSSSLVAAHLACQSLWSGESTLAVTGGVNAILSPAITIGFSKLKAMAADGRCKAFDARADGFVRSEGAGIVVLKLLSKAVSDGDPIYSVIRAVAVNQDGRTNGLTAPNGLSQEQLVRRALAQGGVAPADVAYVEAHGTGTALGDPIELNALGNVLAEGRPSGRRCAVGSVKANVGHLEAAAGVAGLIKVALTLKHREIPPSIHFQDANPYIPFDALPLYVQKDLAPWPDPGPAYACVSSFGFGGTNACAVLAEAPAVEAANESEPVEGQSYLLPLSASTPDALRALASSYRSFLETSDPSQTTWLRDVSYTASTRRTHHDHRLAIAARGRPDLFERLEAFGRGETRSGMASGRRAAGRRPKLAFVFSGHGAQWLGMGRALLSKEGVFREELEKCDRALGFELSWSLLARLNSGEDELELGRVGIIQPTVFGIQVGLAALWRHWGIEPDAVVGHSMGEVAAAHVAGILTLEDAAKVICRRSRLLARISGQGAMASVELSADEAREVLRGYENRVSIGAVNSRRSTVLSGDPEAISEIQKKLEDRGVYGRSVKTDVAFHGPQVDPLTSSLQQELEGLRPRPASIPLYSTVTGSTCEGPELDASYWARNLREPVVFSTAVRALSEGGFGIFLEMSPHPTLLPAIQQELSESDVVLLPSMKRGEDEQAVMLGSLGVLYTMGRPVAWEKLYAEGGRSVPLPPYPWQRERFWIEEPSSASITPAPGAPDQSRGVVSEFYDSLSRTRAMQEPNDAGQGGAYLTFGPVLRPIPGFSWLNAFFNPTDHESTELVVKAQKELRAALFGRVDFSGVAKVLDFGCGYSSDVITLAEQYRHLRLDGFTISAEQAAIGNQKVRARSLSDRVRIFNRDSAMDEFPDQYDLMFGLEVVGLIKDKQGLFSNISRHLAKSGLLLMADFVANTALSIDHDEFGTHASNAKEWSDVLARNGLRVLECIDVSQEIANCLDDPDFETNLERLAREQALSEIVQKNLRSFNNYGKALRRRFLNYCLFIVQSDGYLLKNELLRINEEKLEALVPYVEGLRRSTSFQDGLEVWEASAEIPSEGCFYQVGWERKELPREEISIAGAGEMNGSWLIFADSQGFGDELEAGLTRRGARSILVSPGARYERVSGNHFRIRADFREDIARLLDELEASSLPRLLGAVHLWSLDAAPPAETTLGSLQEAQSLGCGSVIHLIQAVAGRDWEVPPRLWLATRTVQPVPGRATAVPAVAEAPLWGLGRSIAQQYPALWGGLIALDDLVPQEGAALLSRELSASDGEDQIALRNDGRYVARLARLDEPIASSGALSIRQDASYLITGGLGDLGLLVARFLVQHGARSLILLGRSKLPPRSEWDQIEKVSRQHQQVAAIRALEGQGAKVHVASVDVSDEAQVRGFLDRWNVEDGPIRGVVHAAGWVGIRSVQELDLDTLDATMRPKVAGGWILHEYFANRPLDFFVLFSSAASVLGFLGLGHYAAANAFLDGLAHYRQSLGLPALSINWGPWSDVGMAARTDQVTRFSSLGMRSIPPARGLELLEQLLAHDSPQVVTVDVDWQQFARSFQTGAGSPLLSKFVTRSDSRRPSVPTGKRGSNWDAVRAADPEERRELLESELRERVSNVLGLSPSKLDVQKPLVEMGMDSLMGVELKNQIESELGVTLSLIELLQGASISRLASVLADKLGGADSSESSLSEAVTSESAVSSLARRAARD
jgi:myxalamid-type polyketide synthase MxaE and MxaD